MVLIKWGIPRPVLQCWVMKTWKVLAVCLLVGTLLSCDLFLVPMKGRLNPADSGSALVPVDKNVFPIIDGSIDNTSARDFSGPHLRVWYGTPMTDTLLRFDPAAFPAVIDSVTLELYCSSATNAGTVAIFRIIQDWSSASLSWSQVTSPAFYDPALYSNLYPDTTPKYYSIDVTDMIRKSVQQGQNFGLLLCISSTANFDFCSTRSATDQPYLRVKGSDNP
jgi:hypothetical protein